LQPTSPTALRCPLPHSAPRTRLLHHLSRVPGRGHRPQPPQGLHGRGHPVWQPASPWQTAGSAPRQACRNQAGLVFRPAGLFAFLFNTAPRQSRNRFPTRQGGFCTPGTGGAFTVSTVTVPVLSMGTATEIRPLTYSPSSHGPELGGSPVETCLHTWLMVKPVGCTLAYLNSPCISAAM
jgi:hypothetical protein